MTETYDDLQWNISDMPVGCSTPDELFEYSYRAETKCPNCGESISGTAQYWSREEDGNSSWLERIDYAPCECE